MTIVAGFRCSDGIVLCADTQETVGGISKRNVPKLRFEETPAWQSTLGGTDLAVAFCGATNNGAFVDKLVDLAWSSAKNEDDIDNVCAAIEQSIKDTYREYGTIYQKGYLPDTELIYGVKMSGDSRMFNALGPVVNERQEYCTGGVGSYMADFIAERMYTTGLTLQQCVILAAYVLFQTKEHVDGCGGKSNIAILREEGQSGVVNSDRIKLITSNLERADYSVGKLLLASSDLDLTEEQFENEAKDLVEFLTLFRKDQRKKFKDWKDFQLQFNAMFGITNDVDSFGIIMPSTSQKEEPKP